MEAIEATARTAKTLQDGTLRLIIEFEPKDARNAFNSFCEQGKKLAVVALNDGYLKENLTNATDTEVGEVKGLDAVKPEEWNEVANKAKIHKINGGWASSWAYMQTKNSNFWDFMEVKNADECDARLKDILNIQSKSELDTNDLAFNEFRKVLHDFSFYCEVRGIGNVPPLSRAHALRYLGGCMPDDEDDISLTDVND